MRDRKLVERLAELPVPAVVELLHDLVRLAEENDPDAQVTLACCVGLQRFERTLGYDWLAQVYVTADDKGYPDVKRLLATSEVSKRPRRRDQAENDHIERPLGERVALARSTRDRDLLDRLLFDRNPDVIRMLLHNPRIIERDAVKIAAMRPTVPALLDEVMRHPRWSTNYAVRKALAFNPYIPANTAISLLPFLLAQDLRQVVDSTELNDSIRSAARDLLARRRNDPPETLN